MPVLRTQQGQVDDDTLLWHESGPGSVCDLELSLGLR